MNKVGAKDYVNSRWNDKDLKDLSVQDKTNILIAELRQNGFIVTVHDQIPMPVKGIQLTEKEITYHV